MIRLLEHQRKIQQIRLTISCCWYCCCAHEMKCPPSTETADTLPSSTVQHTIKFETTLKPRGIRITVEEEHEEHPATSQDALTTAEQNYFSTYYHHPSLPPLGHSRPYYQATEEPFFRTYLNQQHQKHFLTKVRPQAFTHYDSSILGSGDFGILRGGTFYSDEDLGYHQESTGDFYYSDASSNSHSGPATEGFIQKYTYPEEQFAQFRDFADLNAPSEADFSQYVVVYAPKNSSSPKTESRHGPNNIFEQLQQIDEEKAAEERKLKKNTSSTLSSKKMKLVKTKIVKKKWLPKVPKVINEEDPLLALS
ncbi:uncharacterized protein LOC101894288 isoform X2 [Musca domestica]|uniref:Uncharacterized protein LOC101894288 isoform X2 n=1 Tax=Musca domestica TaxID=7370 RepID=A0ABM3UN02_MUSDO|nr:uncharacterized protein LOC101894288 isoform X2 [Musca domestica]